jgi:hypothetical protein
LSDPGTAPLLSPSRPTAAYRGLLAAVILLGVLIAIALGVLVIGLVTRFSGGHGNTARGPAQFTLAAGTRIVSVDVSADRLILRLHGPAGDEIDIIDTQTGRLIAKVRAAAPSPRP